MLGLGAYGIFRLVRSQQGNRGSGSLSFDSLRKSGSNLADNVFGASAPARSSSGMADNSFGSAPSSVSTGTTKAAPVLPADGQAANDELLHSAVSIFRDLQSAQSNSDIKKAQQLATGQVLADVESAIREGNSGTIGVHSVEIDGNIVRDFVSENGNYMGSVYFVAEISENNGPIETVEEMWHFQRPVSGGSWKVAGIEQI